ncbi:hypothetical protein [Aggregatibacter kilianii]|jgi:hypothetical protein|uniref:hypothetical protein n=1 Tax=Aggregatibacter kilianii TaxID=2025884 RepID=UPI000D647A84|nr:hypothetical protein [Aggregatibacter kilianii]DAK67500.1 MAG TPA: hypothetical protein [Caudoviricetes sp.]DAW72847.1 MAG TPA: hypothetical protein [Caudoviricetes sp.]
MQTKFRAPIGCPVTVEVVKERRDFFRVRATVAPLASNTVVQPTSYVIFELTANTEQLADELYKEALLKVRELYLWLKDMEGCG